MVEEKLAMILDYFRNKSSQFFSKPLLTDLSVNRCWQENDRHCVEYSLEIHPKLCNVFGFLHGGAVAIMADDLASLTIMANQQIPTMILSAQLSVVFCSSARRGEILRIRMKCVRMANHFFFGSVEIYAEQKLIATGTHTLVFYQPSIPSPEQS